MDFNTMEALLGFGAGCVSGYGFALRVLVPAMIASKVGPLEAKQEQLIEQVEDLSARLIVEEAFNKTLKEKLFKLDTDKDGSNNS